MLMRIEPGSLSSRKRAGHWIGFLIAVMSLLPLGSTGIAQADSLEEKDREIRNLRRRIFDLESQLPNDSRQEKLRLEIKTLQQEHKQKMARLESEYDEQTASLKGRIKDLEKQISSLGQEHAKLIKQQQTEATAALKKIQADLNEKEKQLLQSNEVLTETLAERSTLEGRLKQLQTEYDGLSKEMEQMREELADRRKSRQRLISRTEKPLLEKISILEKQIAELRKTEKDRFQQLKEEYHQLQQGYDKQRSELTTELKQVKAELLQNERRLAEISGSLTEKEEALQSAMSRLKDLEQEQESVKTVRRDMKAAENKAAEDKERALSDLRSMHRKIIDGKDKDMAGLKEQIDGLQQTLKEQAESNRKDRAELQVAVKERNKALSNVEENIQQATKPLRETIAALEQAAEKQRLKLEAAQENRDLLSSQLKDKDEKIAVYMKLVDKQESDIKALRQELAAETKDLEKTLAAERAPLEKQIVELEKQVLALQKQVQLQRVDIEKEFNARQEKLQAELSSAKIDLDFQTNKNAKLSKGMEQLENTLIAIQEKNDGLKAEVARLKEQMEDTAEARQSARESREAKAELEKRLEILLNENADYQKKVMEMTETLKGISSSEEAARELAEAQELIIGFKKDVDAKTIEISGLVSENHDLRKRLRQMIKEADDWKAAVAKLKAEQLAQITDEEVNQMQEQVNSLRTALSKARQMIAQKDVMLEDILSDRNLLRADVDRLTAELNTKIKAVGELEYAKRNNYGGYSEEDLQAAKKPLLLEISILKERIAKLEKQLVETWNRAEGMLLELKNHPQIKQAGGQLFQEETQAR